MLEIDFRILQNDVKKAQNVPEEKTVKGDE